MNGREFVNPSRPESLAELTSQLEFDLTSINLNQYYL